MLYIFHVDTGTMMTFDMNLALESVSQLKDVIERVCRIPSDKQVLLVSGGESLDPTARVCSYSSGTDTNPIYLFSKCTIESMTPPSLSADYGSDLALKEQVEGSHALPDTYNTVVARVQLAQQFCELAREQTRICERLVHDQHLQQQGWAAVLANLEDITSAFRSRADIFEQSFTQHLETQAEFIQLLENFDEDLDVLAKIPLVPALLSSPDIAEVEAQGENIPSTSLLQWISAKDDRSSLQQVAQQCLQGLQQLDGNVRKTLQGEVEQVLAAAGKVDMKEIKGLEERLFGLEQLMFETKKIVQEQADLAQSFLQNQARASNLGDASILPDLCASHRRQLQVMLSNQQHLLDIRGRCTRAKEELCRNLHMRLKWVMYVENGMCEVNAKLMISYERLKRLRRHLEVMQQIHLAPQMYATAVAEVVRRRTFSRAFLEWASDVACQLLAVHNEEVARRRDFGAQFEGHFLNTLFIGMEDLPPPFATEAPAPFDSTLPKITMEDVQHLREQLPELSFSLSVPDLESIMQFFLVKSVTGTLKQDDKEQAPLEEQLAKVLEAEAPAREPDRGCESEMDTEEFEKVGQSPGELVGAAREEGPLEVGASPTSHSPSQPRQPEFVSADFYIDESMPSSVSEGAEPRRQQDESHTLLLLLQENLGNTRGEVERLQTLVRAVGKAAAEGMAELRQELSLLRYAATQHRDRAAELVIELEKNFLQCMEEEVVRRKRAEERCAELQLRLEQAEAEGSRALRDQSHNYKTELESLRSRFRLMASTSLERSPSDSSLEKIERTDVIELANHEAIVAQIREDLAVQHEAKIQAALDEERAVWKAHLAEQLHAADVERQLAFSEVAERERADRERQLEREATLAAEVRRLEETVRRLADSDRRTTHSLGSLDREGSWPSPPTTRTAPMSTSVAILQESRDSRDAATSPRHSHDSGLEEQPIPDKLTRSATSLIQQGRISIVSCNMGDAVLVVWDEAHGNYKILQETSTLYFLNSDCLDSLGLRLSSDDDSPRRLYSTGEVVEKEYCHAKKSENRYRVPKGTKFYRVKVRPLQKDVSMSRSQHSQR